MKKIDLRPVKRTITSAAVSASFIALTLPTLAHSFTIEFFSSSVNMTRIVDLSLDSLDKRTGDFSGEAVSANNPNEVWEVTGTIVGNKVEIEFSNINASERIVASGKIEDDLIAGKAATEDGELFEWEATDALVSKAAV